MLKEIYCIPQSESRYKEGIIEIEGELDAIIQQVDLLLFTRKGEVLLMPEFGCDLEKYLFETSWNQLVIENMVREQIRNFIYSDGTYSIDVSISFVQWDFNVAMVVDLSINNTKIASYLV